MLHLRSDWRLLPVLSAFTDLKSDQPRISEIKTSGSRTVQPSRTGRQDNGTDVLGLQSTSGSGVLPLASLPARGLQRRVCPLLLSPSMLSAVLEKSRRMSTVSRCSVSDSCTNSCCVSTSSCTDCASASRD